MPFILATQAQDVQNAKNQAKKTQAAAYRHDVAWSVYTESAATAAWIKAYAKNARFAIFLSTPQTLPTAPAFSGQNAGYNAGLALGFLFEQPVILLAEADLTANAIENLATLEAADAIQGSCFGFVDEPAFFQDAVKKTLQSLSAGVVRPDFAANQLQAALEGTLAADYANPCYQGMAINAHAITNACLPPQGQTPIDVYANEAFRFGVRVLESQFAWTTHPPSQTPDPQWLEKAWAAREKTNAYLRILDYILDKTATRTASDFLIDEALKAAYYEPKAAITQAQYRQILTLRRPELSIVYARLTRLPAQPDKGQLKKAIKAYLAAQASWKETLRQAGEQGLEEQLRIK